MNSFFKLFIFVQLLVLGSLASAVPVCVQSGLADEGWRLADGSVEKTKCSDRVAFCEADGQMKGWHSAVAVEPARMVGYANCSEISLTKPTCAFVGTDMEGWITPAGVILKDKCESKVAFCTAVGTRSEGWAVVAIDPTSVAQIATTEKCGSEDSETN